MICERQNRTIYILVFLYSAAFFSLNSAQFLSHQDLGWHIISGDLIISGFTLPISDPFSFTPGDYPWILLSWLWDAAISGLYGIGSLSLIFLVHIFIAALTLANIALIGLRRGYSTTSCVLGAFLGGLALTFYSKDNPQLCLAPQLLSLFFTSIQLLLLETVPKKKSLNTLLISQFTLTLFWANTHGGFLISFTLIGAYILASLIHRDIRAAWITLSLGVLSFLAALINPYGFEIYKGILRSTNHPSKEIISEWFPLTLNSNLIGISFIPLFFILLFVNRDRIRLSDLMTLLPWLLAGILEQRHFSVFIVLSILPLSASQKNLYHSRTIRLLWHALIIVPVITYQTINAELPRSIYPKEAVTKILSKYRKGNLLNDWSYGGYLIYRSKGTLPVFIDGRAGTAYPIEVFNDYVEVCTSEEPKNILDKYDIKVVFISKSKRRLSSWLEAHNDWTIKHSDNQSLIYVKKPIADP